MEILLNSKKYVCESVTRRPMQPFAPATASAATSARQNIVMRDWFVMSPGICGFGPRRTAYNPIHAAFTSTSDTRFKDAITNARLRVATAHGFAQTLTRIGVVDRDQAIQLFSSRIYSDATANSIRLGTRTLLWAGTPQGARAFGATSHGKYLLACGNDVGGTEANLRVFYWDTATGSGTLAAGHSNGMPGSLTTTVTRRDTVTDFGGTMMTFGDTVLLFAYIWDGSAQAVTTDATAGKILILRTTNAVAATGQWYTHGMIQSIGGVSAATTWKNSVGQSTPVFATAEGIYAVNLSYDTDLSDSDLRSTELLLALPPALNNGRALSVYHGNLMISSASGAIFEMVYRGPGQFSLEEVTPPYNDYQSASTLPYYGTAGIEHQEYWFLGYSSTQTGETSKILAFNGTCWHYISQAATSAKEIVAMNMDFVNNTLQWEESAGTSNYTIAKINLGPDAGSSISYETSSILELPDYDGGMPEESAIFLYAYANFDSTAGSVIIKYGLDGAVSTTTTLGTATVAAPTVNFGSGVGASGRRIRFQLTLTGGSATDPVKLREFVVAYLKIPTTRYVYDVVIDIDASARELQRSRETIITDLEAIFDTVTMVPFQWSQVAAVNVKAIPPWQYTETIGEATGSSMVANQDRHGSVQLLLVELL